MITFRLDFSAACSSPPPPTPQLRFSPSTKSATPTSRKHEIGNIRILSRKPTASGSLNGFPTQLLTTSTIPLLIYPSPSPATCLSGRSYPVSRWPRTDIFLLIYPSRALCTYRGCRRQIYPRQWLSSFANPFTGLPGQIPYHYLEPRHVGLEP